MFVRREDAERFIEEVRGDDPEAAEKLRIEVGARGARADLERYFCAGNQARQQSSQRRFRVTLCAGARIYRGAGARADAARIA